MKGQKKRLSEVVRVDYHCIVMVLDPEDEMIDKALSFLDLMVKESEGDLVIFSLRRASSSLTIFVCLWS
jgi:hypothetical protein